MNEPSTTAKVTLNTSKGPIELELWAKEAPVTCRNFLQLCINGYYNGCTFHRIVKDFIIQGGDPSGTGYGNQTIYGEVFKDEFHTRLRFSRRGILASANAGKPNTNGSQFLITLAAAPELQNKNTIFGKVIGDTYFNVLRISEAEVDENDAPLYPTTIDSVEITERYFDDLEEPALNHGNQLNNGETTKSSIKAPKRAKKAVVNFDEEDAEDDDEAVIVHKKIKPAHELLKHEFGTDRKKPKQQPLSAELDVDNKPEKTAPETRSTDTTEPNETSTHSIKEPNKLEQELTKSKIPGSASSREAQTLAMLESFKNKLDNVDSQWSSSDDDDLHSD